MTADRVLEEIHRIAGVSMRPTRLSDEANPEPLVIHVRTGAEIIELTEAILKERATAPKEDAP